MHSSKGRRRMKTSSRVFFFFIMRKTKKSFAFRPCIVVVIVVATTMCMSVYVYMYIFSFQLLLLSVPWWCVQVCYSLLLSFSFFLFFDSIDARNGEYFTVSFSPSFLLCYNLLYSYILFRCVPYAFLFRRNDLSYHSAMIAGK